MSYDNYFIKTDNEKNLYIDYEYIETVSNADFVKTVADSLRLAKLNDVQFNSYDAGRLITVHYMVRVDEVIDYVGILSFDNDNKKISNKVISTDDLKRFRYMGLNY